MYGQWLKYWSFPQLALHGKPLPPVVLYGYCAEWEGASRLLVYRLHDTRYTFHVYRLLAHPKDFTVLTYKSEPA